MPGSTRNKRQPISCEPCRVRKIRCSRDGEPCSTCTRRGVSCRYARRPRENNDVRPQYDSPYARRVSSTSTIYTHGDEQVESLAERVRRLEKALLNHTGNGGSSSFARSGHNTTIAARGVSAGEIRASGGSAVTNDFSGTLQTDPGGYVRFVPGSLRWRSSRSADVMAVTSTSKDTGNVPFGTSTATADDVLDSLPSQDQCAELVNIYFQSYASLFHLLHGPTFQEQYRTFCSNASSTSLSWLALLYAILGTAVQALPPGNQLLGLNHRGGMLRDVVGDLSFRYRTLAMRCLELDHFLWKHNVVTLQALIILIYSINHSHGQSWSLLGLCHHIALSVGCHVDPGQLGLDTIQCEERRRCWAAFKMLYTQQNTALGHFGTAHTNFPSNCLPPANVDDDTLHVGAIDRKRDPSQHRSPSQMTYLLYKFRLYDICTDICETVLSKEIADLDAIVRLQRDLSWEKASWQACYLGDNAPEERLPPHHLAHLHILEGYYHHLTLLLIQTIIAKSAGSEHEDIFQKSCTQCMESAKSILNVHADMYSDEDLAPFRWYVRGVGSFQALHAAVVVLMLSQRGARGLDIAEAVPLLSTCRDRFVLMAEQSAFCARAVDLFSGICTKVANIASEIGTSQTDRALAGQSHSEIPPLPTPTSYVSNAAGVDSGPQSEPGVSLSSSNEDHDLLSLDAFLADIQPQLWLSPSTFPLFEQWA